MRVKFYDLLRRQIPHLPDLSASSRGGLYRRVVGAMGNFLSRDDISLAHEQKLEFRRDLDEAIKRVEQEFSDARQAGQYAPDWALPPRGVEDVPKKTNYEPAQIIDNWDEPAPEPSRASRGLLGLVSERLRVIRALLLHFIRSTSGAEPAAYLWLVAEPLIQVGVVVSLYYAMGLTIIYSMPAIPFAIIGIGGWLMFRTILMRVGTGLGREYVLVGFPLISRFDVHVAKSLFFGITYLITTLLALYVYSLWDGSVFAIRNPVEFLALWSGLWLYSLGFALAMATVVQLLPSTKRVLLVVIRGLYLLSGVVVVSEQFSEEDKFILLWNPLVHGMQLLRSTYFHEYTSQDAVPGFFLAATAGLFVLGLTCERAQRRWEIVP